MHAAFCDALLAPRSIALVGASERNFYARNALARLDECGYAGEVHLVNPNSATVLGRRCHASLVDVGRPVEMAFIAVPRQAVMGALADCAAAGTRAAVIVTTGFSESHDVEGRRLQAGLAAFVRANPMAVCGPSCLGVINVHGRFQAFGGHTGTAILPGRIALVSQSGANVHSYLGGALARNLGFSFVVSCGNEIGVEASEYIGYFLRDANTQVVCAYVESFRDPENLIRVATLAREVRKPIVAIKIGRSASSMRAALAHTGSMTGADAFYDTLFRQYGILRADTVEEALDRATVFASSARRWWPARGRVGVVSVSGGFGSVFADLARGDGARVDAGPGAAPVAGDFALPELDPVTTARLADALPPHVSPQNPIDISTQVQRDRPEAWAQTVDAIAADPGVDLLLDAEAVPQTEARLRTLLALRERHGKPLLLASTSPHIPILDEPLRALCRESGLPLLAGADACRRAVEASLRFAAAAAEAAAADEAAPRGPGVEAAGRRAADGALVADGAQGAPAGTPSPLPRPAATVLHEVEARELLARYGIDGPRGECVAKAADAAAAAARIGGERFALKMVSRAITHRSDLGLVDLDVAAADVVARAAALEQRLRAARGSTPRRKHAIPDDAIPDDAIPDGAIPEHAILVQQMLRGVAELFVGVSARAGARPMLVVGFGGVFVELLGDRSTRICPVDAAEATRMLHELRLFPALDGYRGRPRADVDAAARAIAALSRFAVDAAHWLGEAEVNPLLLLPAGEGVRALDALVVARANDEEAR